MKKNKIFILFFLFLIGSTIHIDTLLSAEKNLPEAIKKTQDYYLEGKKLILKGDYEKANEVFKKAEQILKETYGEYIKTLEKNSSESKEKLFKKAEQAFKEGKLEEAIEAYKNLITFYPKNYNLHYNLGVVYLKKGDYLNAAKEFEEVISLNKRDTDAYYNLGIIYENFLNDKKRAIEFYKQYLKYSTHEKEKKEVKRWVNFLKEERDF
jgi:tetratricopeptide (TPR) repeat protein